MNSAKDMMRLGAVVLLSLSVWHMAGARAVAQDSRNTNSRAETVTVSGQGSVETQPDHAYVSFSVVTQAKKAASALSQNNVQMQTVISALEEKGIAEEDIQTQSVSLIPIYASDRKIFSADVEKISQYRAVNTLQVRAADLMSLGLLIDTAVGAGVNEMQGIRFEVEDSQALLDQARREAWLDALHKAQQLAELAGVKLGPAVEIQATDFGVQPYMQQNMYQDVAGGPPIRPGMQTRSVSLQVTWKLVAAEEPPAE